MSEKKVVAMKRLSPRAKVSEEARLLYDKLKEYYGDDLELLAAEAQANGKGSGAFGDDLFITWANNELATYADRSI